MRHFTEHAPAVVVDLFSGGGGMSCGFARMPGFSVVGAVDLERGKPSAGATGCNGTYRANIGIDPLRADLSVLDPHELREAVLRFGGVDLAPGRLDVLSACPPCTDFSRAKPANHLVDGGRNDLVGRVGDFVEYFRPRHLAMENAREFLHGTFRHHAERLIERLRGLGYEVATEVAMLTGYGLPQLRERALLVASRTAAPRMPGDLWAGHELDRSATTVRAALGRLAGARALLPGDDMDRSPAIGPEVRARLGAVPADGGSWADLVRARPDLLTPGMAARAAAGVLNHHPDAYGRMAWSRPAPTIKRECSHVGNGRYAHPELDRLLTIREMAALQGFPFDYRFVGALKNSYRQIGDAVPPIVSFQIAACIRWMETGIRPSAEAFVLPDCVLRADDVLHAAAEAA